MSISLGNSCGGGARWVQIREKVSADADLYRQLVRIREVCRLAGARFIVNDRVDLALASGADGVHLGQNDLPVEAARRILGPGAIIGLSTHNRAQFESAQGERVDYIAVGPIYPTATKETGYAPLGSTLLLELRAKSCHPLVAIGGINLGNVANVWRSGADSAAVISDIVNDPDPAGRVRQYLKQAEAVLK
ncbi:MAG: thiamine phosphate synthase [Acidobacteriota bacterium]